MSDNTQPDHKPGVYEAEQVYRHLNPGPEDVLRDILTELQAIRRLLEQREQQGTSLINAVSPTHRHYVCPRCGAYVQYGSSHMCGGSTA